LHTNCLLIFINILKPIPILNILRIQFSISKVTTVIISLILLCKNSHSKIKLLLIMKGFFSKVFLTLLNCNILTNSLIVKTSISNKTRIFIIQNNIFRLYSKKVSNLNIKIKSCKHFHLSLLFFLIQILLFTLSLYLNLIISCHFCLFNNLSRTTLTVNK
jgi:hypothetical protein